MILWIEEEIQNHQRGEGDMSLSDKQQKIKECFPILSKIKDPALRDKVVQCWVRMWEESAWKDVKDCPFTPPFPDISLVDHINCVGDMVLATADILEKHNKEIKLDRDYLITGILLHDLSKLLEIEPAPEGYRWGKLLKLMPHATYGAMVAVAEGLSPRVANIILSHSRWTGTSPASPEAVLLHYMDYGLADVLRSCRELPLIVTGAAKP
jgi:putative nucleotidyltransferase with HDIG domain